MSDFQVFHHIGTDYLGPADAGSPFQVLRLTADPTKTEWADIPVPPVVVPGGANTNIQYNDGGVFGGDANFTWNKTASTLTITHTSQPIIDIKAGVNTFSIMQASGISILVNRVVGGSIMFGAGNHSVMQLSESGTIALGNPPPAIAAQIHQAVPFANTVGHRIDLAAAATADALQINNSASINLFKVTAAGNVAINTPTPSATAKLHITVPTSGVGLVMDAIALPYNLIQLNSYSTPNVFVVTSVGTLNMLANVNAYDFQSASSGNYGFVWVGRAGMYSPGAGIITLRDIGISFDRVQFGGTTVAFPAIKRSGTSLQIKLADDSALTGLECGGLNSTKTTEQLRIGYNTTNYFAMTVDSGGLGLITTPLYHSITLRDGGGNGGVRFALEAQGTTTTGNAELVCQVATATSGNPKLSLRSNVGGGYQWTLYGDTADAGKFKIRLVTGNVTMLTLTASGFFGLGYNPDIPLAALHQFLPADTVAHRMDLLSGHTSDAIQVNSFGVTGGNLFRVSSSGSITISGTYTGTGISGIDGSGLNSPGGNLSYNAGRGTGSAVGGDHIFYTTPAGTSGSGLNTLVERMRITAAGYLLNAFGIFNVISGGNSVGYEFSATGGRHTLATGNPTGVFLQFGWDNNAAYPALKRSGTSLLVRLGNDSANAPFETGALKVNITPTSEGSIQLGISGGGTFITSEAGVVATAIIRAQYQVWVGPTSGAFGMAGNRAGAYFDLFSGSAIKMSIHTTGKISIGSASVFGWTATTADDTTLDTGIIRRVAGLVEFNNGTSGILRDSIARISYAGYFSGGLDPISANAIGSSLYLVGGKATGNAAGGSIIFQTSDVLTSGSTVQNLTTKLQIDSFGGITATSTSAAQFIFQGSASGSNQVVYLKNTSASTANNGLQLLLEVAGASAGDPFISFSAVSAFIWYMGVDNSDLDKFKLSYGYALGGLGDQFVFTGGGALTITGGLTASAFKMTTTPTAGHVLTSDATGVGTWAGNKVTFGITIGDGSTVITTGFKKFGYAPCAMRITGWYLLADVAGDIVIDVWKTAFGAAFPTVANTITGTEKPTLTAQQENRDIALSTWTGTTVAEGDKFGYNVVSAATVKAVQLVIIGEKL